MKITRTALEFILGASRGAHPREFIGMLRADGDTITETLIIPGSKFEECRSSILAHMVPMDTTIIGSIHSHPGPPRPSRADLEFFRKMGRFHMIVGYPYSPRDIAVFNSDGSPASLELSND